MSDKNTEQTVQFHAVPTGTSDVVALAEKGSICEIAIGLVAQSFKIEVNEKRVHVQCTEASKKNCLVQQRRP